MREDKNLRAVPARFMVRAALAAALLLAAACSDDATPAADTGPLDAAALDLAAPDLAAPDAAGPDLTFPDFIYPDITPDMHPTGAPPAIDGLFADWKGIPVLVTDAKGDVSGAFDVTTVKAASRGTKVYLYFEVGKILNANAGPASDGNLQILFTLPSGTRLTVDPRKLKAWTGAAPGAPFMWTALGYSLMPTYASSTFEARVDLAAVGAKAGDSVTLDFAGSDTLAKPVSIKLDQPAHTSATRSPARAAGATFRVASLNVLMSGLTHSVRGPKLKRLIKAAAADIYCFQEVYTGSAASVASALTALDPVGDGATWSAVKFGDDVVASRGSLVKLPAENAGDKFVGAAITLDGKKLVVYSLHPKCCGFKGDISDLLRTAEVKYQAVAIMKLRAGTLGASFKPWRTAPMVVAGDWNLVGSREPLDIMLNRNGGPGLLHLMLRHLNSSDVYTWYGAKYGSFPPGLLDLLVHSPDLKPRGGHVLDTAKLDSAMLTKLGLQAGDSAGSDHLMLVADLAL